MGIGMTMTSIFSYTPTSHFSCIFQLAVMLLKLYFCTQTDSNSLNPLVRFSSFRSSVLGRRADPSAVSPETGAAGVVSAKQSSWRKCSKATRRASAVTFRRPPICTRMPCKLTHRTASCTATVRRRSSNWDNTGRRWTMLSKLVSSIPSGPR